MSAVNWDAAKKWFLALGQGALSAVYGLVVNFAHSIAAAPTSEWSTDLVWIAIFGLGTTVIVRLTNKAFGPPA